MSESVQIPHVVGDYVLKRQIGKGSFATVWRAEHRLAKKFVAIKVVDNSSIDSVDARTRFVREVQLIKQMDHPFISKLFDVVETPDFTFLIMEYAENGSILNYVNSHGRLSEKQARRYFSQMISALEYLHDERRVAHRDLKAENVLLDRNLNIRLIDFGLSNIFSDEAPELSTACGSPAYASPEMVRGQTYTKMADIWSAGVLLYAMVTGQLPFDDDNMQHLLQKIAFTEPQYPSYLSPQLVDLLKKILTKNPEQRATFKKIRDHPWFSQSEYSQLMSLKFSMDEQWRVNGVDREIVDTISSLGIDVRKLPNDLLCGEYNEITAVYAILRRDKITDRTKEMMLSLNSPLSLLKFGCDEENTMVPQPKTASRQSSPRPVPLPSARPRLGSTHNIEVPQAPPSPKAIPRPRKNSQMSRINRGSVGDAAKVPSKPPTPRSSNAVPRSRRSSMIV